MSVDTVVLVATPVLAFAGAFGGHLLTRKGARELDRWRKREETMRLLRWATELAVEDDKKRSYAGLAVLDALMDSPLLDDEDVDFVSAIVTHVMVNAS